MDCGLGTDNNPDHDGRRGATAVSLSHIRIAVDAARAQNCIEILRYAAGPGRCGLVHALDLEYGLESQPTCVLYENYAVIVVADRIGAAADSGNGTFTQYLLDYAGRYIPLF